MSKMTFPPHTTFCGGNGTDRRSARSFDQLRLACAMIEATHKTGWGNRALTGSYLRHPARFDFPRASSV